MSDATVLGIDAGTGSAPAGLFDLAGHAIAEGRAGDATTFPALGWAEQDPGEVWDAVARAARTARVSNLSDSDYERVDEVAGLLAEKGTGLGGPWSDHLEGQTWELRVRLARWRSG